MHTMVLGLAGYGLLLSSSVALLLLLRIGRLKDILKSPLHILSTSDTLISMITSIILLVNQTISPTNFDQALPSLGDNAMGNEKLPRRQEGQEYYQNQTCMRFYEKYNDSWLDSQDTNGTETNCTFQHVLMHYAMFLVPFANAFVSLLIYSVQCSSGMSCVDKKCSSLTRASKVPNLNFRKRESEAQEDINAISEDPKIDANTQETILDISNDGNVPMNLNNNPKFTSLGLITQWLIPVLVTAILYFSKTQDLNKLHESNEMECIFKVNFPFESCYKSELADVDTTKIPNDYSELTFEVEVPDTLRISSPDSEAIDEVVSRVRKVVQSAMNKTCNNSTELKSYNSFRPWNITKYVKTVNLTQQTVSDDNEMLEKLIDIQQVLNNKNLEISGNNDCDTKNEDKLDKTDQETSEDVELKLFEDLVESTNSKTTPRLPPQIEEIMSEDLVPREVTTAATIARNADMQTTLIDNTTDDILNEEQSEAALYKTSKKNETVMIKAANITGKLNDQIFADIIKRIRDTVIQVKVKGQTGNLRDNYEPNKRESRTAEAGILLGSGSRKFREMRKSSENFFTEHKATRVPQVPLDTNEGCFLSTEFLKIHLLILLFLIYFIPVLVSGILQTRAVYMCKNVYDQIQTAKKRDLKISQTPDPNRIKIQENPPSKSGWFSTESDIARQTESANPRNMKSQDPSATFQVSSKIDDKDAEDDAKTEEKRTGFKNILRETNSMQMLFNMLTKSLILGTLMWTPAFLEVLSKVFLCATTPSWLVNALYLLGVSFGMVKNFLNVSIAKIDTSINDEIYGKENSVHPRV